MRSPQYLPHDEFMTPKRKRKITLILVPVLFLGTGAILLALQFFPLHSPLKERSVSVNGQPVQFLQSGKGPHLIVLAPKETDQDWNEIAKSWLESYTLSVLNDTSPEALGAVLSEIKATSIFLLGYDKAAPAAIVRAAEIKDRVSKLILISPILDESWQWRASATAITQSTLLIWGRNDPQINPGLLTELNHGLRNAQMSFHPQAQNDLIAKNPKWVAEKVRNFLTFTR